VAGAMIFADRSRQAPCPEGMVHVAGEYCPNVVQRCLKWMDPPGSRYEDYRCAEYARPAKCASARRQLDYCIDRDEVARDGTDLPTSEQSWTDADNYCRSVGKRTCLQSEWQFACEGTEMRPYPYGFTRDASACNADLTDIYEADRSRIKDLRAPHGSHPRCTSPFGVRDLTGNLEEFVTIDGPGPSRPAMMGAWWQPSRNHCRARQTAHNAYYKGRETGFRCCSAPDSAP
jgi:formylglycine-generating enzyme